MTSSALSSARGAGARGVSAGQRIPVRARRALRNPKLWFGLAVLAPTLAWYVWFAFRPVIMALPLSFQFFSIADRSLNRWVGLQNYRILFNNVVLSAAVKNTIAWALLNASLSLVTAMAISVCLVTVMHGRNLYQGLIYLPAVVSMVAVALLFRILFEPQTGQVNMILRFLHLPEGKWLTSTGSALITCVFIDIWKGIGGTVIILTAGMLNVPEELYDAARVDGVNTWQKFWKVTLPLMAHTLLLVTVLIGISSLQAFTGVFVLTGGGPGLSTTLYNVMLYNVAFVDFQLGVASAAALLLFVVIVAISLAQVKFFRPAWSY